MKNFESKWLSNEEYPDHGGARSASRGGQEAFGTSATSSTGVISHLKSPTNLVVVPTSLIYQAMDRVQLSYQIWNVAAFMSDSDWSKVRDIDLRLDAVMHNPPGQRAFEEAIKSWEKQTLEVFKQARLGKKNEELYGNK